MDYIINDPELSPGQESQTVNNYQDIKANIDEEYAQKPHGGSKTPWIIIGITIALLIIFLILILLFFLVFNTPAMHEISIVNNCSQSINVLVGSDNDLFLPVSPIPPGQVKYYQSTPGVYLIVQGYYQNDLNNGPFTTVKLWLNGQNFSGKTQITNGTDILPVPYSSGPAGSNEDIYSVSMQNGFNIPIGILSTNFNNRDNKDKFSCSSPIWTPGYIIGETPFNPCPPELQFPQPGSDYQACMSPCYAANMDMGITGAEQYCCTAPGSCGLTGGCESSWPDQDYYSTFYDACPTCMITNCDTPLYHCGSVGGLTQYMITFCPKFITRK